MNSTNTSPSFSKMRRGNSASEPSSPVSNSPRKVESFWTVEEEDNEHELESRISKKRSLNRAESFVLKANKICPEPQKTSIPSWNFHSIPCDDRILKVRTSPDGNKLACCTKSSVDLIDSHSKERINRIDPDFVAKAIAFSFDSKWLYIGGESALIFVWASASNDGSGKPSKTISLEEEDDAFEVRDLNCSSDGKYLAIAASSQIFLWDVALCVKVWGWKMEGDALSCSFSFNSASLVACGGKYDAFGELRAFDCTSKEIEHEYRQKDMQIYDCKFSPKQCANIIAFCDGGINFFSEIKTFGSVSLFSLTQNLVLRRWEFSQQVYCLAFSPSGNLLASGDGRVVGGEVCFWDLESGFLLRKFCHEAAVFSIAFSQDGKSCWSGGYDMNLRQWECSTSRTLKSIHCDLEAQASSFSPNAQFLAVASKTFSLEFTVIIWNTKSYDKVQTLPHSGRVHAIDFNPSSSALVSSSSDGIRLWEVQTGKLVRTIQQNNIYACCFSSNSVLAYGGGNEQVAVAKSLMGNLLDSTKIIVDEDGLGTVYTVSWSPNCKFLTAGGDRKCLIIYDFEGQKILHRAQHLGAIHCSAFSPDSKTVYAGGHDDHITFWNVKSGDAIRQVGHSNWVNCIAASFDGYYIASGGADRSLILWDTSTGEKLQEMKNTTSVSACSFSPDRDTLCFCLAGKDDNGKAIFLSHYRVDSSYKELLFEGEPQLHFKPYLLQSQDINGETFLHQLVRYGTFDQLQTVLANATKICPVSSYLMGVSETPLDVAIKLHEHGKSKLLLTRYLRDATPQHLGLSCMETSMLLLSSTFPDLLVLGLQLSIRKTPSLSFENRRMRMNHVLFEPSEEQVVPTLWTAEAHGCDTGKDVHVQAYLVGFQAFLAPNALFQAITNSKSMKAFETNAMIYAISYKWERYGRLIHTLRFLMYFVILVLYSMGCLELNRGTMTRDFLYFWYSASLCGFYLFAELRQLFQHTKNLLVYFSSVWNMLELSVYVGVCSSPFFLMLEGRKEIAYPLCGWTAIAAYMNTLAYLRPYSNTGPLVRMLQQIMNDAKEFILIQVIILSGFLVGLKVMVRYNDSFQGFQNPFVTLYQMLLGDWDLQDFKSYKNEDLLGDEILSLSALFAWGIYLLFASIVAMNLLIAIMGDAFDRVRDNQKVEGRMEKAKVLCEIDQTFLWLLRRQRKKLFPKFFHLLAPTHFKEGQTHITEDPSSDHWEGRVKVIQKAVQSNTAYLHDTIDFVRDNMATMEDSMGSIRKDIESLTNMFVEFKSGIHEAKKSAATKNENEEGKK